MLIYNSNGCFEVGLAIFHLKVAQHQAIIYPCEKLRCLLPFALRYFHVIIGVENKLVLLLAYSAHAEEVTVFHLNQCEESDLSSYLYPQILPVIIFEALGHCLKNPPVHHASPFLTITTSLTILNTPINTQSNHNSVSQHLKHSTNSCC